jgi:hypothetical protein
MTGYYSNQRFHFVELCILFPPAASPFPRVASQTAERRRDPCLPCKAYQAKRGPLTSVICFLTSALCHLTSVI